MSKVLTPSARRRIPDGAVMSLLPRLLALCLFVVLAALTALLWVAAGSPDSARSATPAAGSAVSATAATPANATAPAARPAGPRVRRPPLRTVLPLAIASLVLGAALLVSLGFPGARETRPPFAAARTEIAGLEQLARSSAAQSAALARERNDRARAEENARLSELRLQQSVDHQVRLGRDLHDGIVQTLYATGLLVESTRRVLATDPATADRRLEQSVERINGAIRDVRACISGLTPAHVRRDGFARAVRAAFDELNAAGSASLDTNIDEAAVAALSTEQETELLQIAREACSNSLRHGRAGRLVVRLHPGDGAIALLVQDDGAGFNPAAPTEGHGRTNMQARAARLGATLAVHSQPGTGTRIVLTMPLATTTS